MLQDIGNKITALPAVDILPVYYVPVLKLYPTDRASGFAARQIFG